MHTDKARAMFAHVLHHTHVSRELEGLYFSRTLMRIGFGALGVFLPIFFYTHFGESIDGVLAVYTAIFGMYILMIPFSARLLHALGTRAMMVLGLFFVMCSFTSLYMYDHNPEWTIMAYIASTTLYYCCYWLPYHVDFAELLDPAMRGRQIALLRNIAGGVLIVVPIIGGFLITAYGFSAAFIFSLVMIALAMFPLLMVSPLYERFSWGYIETFEHVFSRRNRELVLANMANGAQGIALTVLWPIYVFMLLDSRYTALGIIVSLSLIVVMILRSTIGKLFDTWSEKRIVWVGVFLATTGWVSKVFVQTPLQVFAADSYHNAGQVANALAFDAATYQQSADNGRFVDEYTVVKEIALTLGRVVMLLSMTILLAFYDLRVAFIVAAVVSLVMIVITSASRVR